MSEAVAYLVETIPLGMETLQPSADAFGTAAVLRGLIDRAEAHIDLAAMYWSLLLNEHEEDIEGLSGERLAELGVDRGRVLAEALANAARRGVNIRILQSPGFRAGPQESDVLAQAYPSSVQVRQLDMREWFGGGIMHQKMMVVDGRHVYIGSANMDWRSLSQVKELGVVIENHEQIAADAASQFEVMWRLCALDPSTTRLFDPEVRIARPVPPWSTLTPTESRAASPWQDPELHTDFGLAHPLRTVLNEEEGDVFITGSPPELSADGRTGDLDGILHTIHTARRSICISVMDFGPKSVLGDEYDSANDRWLFEGEVAPVVWWTTLVDALLQAVITRRVHVRLLISHWGYTSSAIGPYLQALQAQADAFRMDQVVPFGELEIKRFVVPGWNEVIGAERKFPGHSRVNHTKYIVTDQRLNIGTSNLTWSYFATSAGVSFNSTHPKLVSDLQAIFDRDWDSPYALLPDEIS
ncbi:MAG: phospholipase D-like domain-containing protein [Gemmatimonadales bacterium]